LEEQDVDLSPEREQAAVTVQQTQTERQRQAYRPIYLNQL